MLCRGLSKLPVYLATVAYRVDQEYLLRVEYLVDNPEVADSEFVESSRVAAQGLRSDCAVVQGQPIDTVDDASCLRFVEPRQVAGRGIQKASAQGHG